MATGSPVDVIKEIAAGAAAAAAPPASLGEVLGVDDVAYKVRVRLQPSGIETDWLRVASAFAGAGWGIACLPILGAEVVVVAAAGEQIVVGQLFNGQDTPPDAGADLLLQHQSGALVRLKADGKVDVGAADGKPCARKDDPVGFSSLCPYTGNPHISGKIQEGSAVVKIA